MQEEAEEADSVPRHGHVVTAAETGAVSGSVGVRLSAAALAAAELEQCSTPELESSWQGVGRWMSPASPELPASVTAPAQPWASGAQLPPQLRGLGDPGGADAEVRAWSSMCHAAHPAAAGCTCMSVVMPGAGA
jgi:hypothetical protein